MHKNHISESIWVLHWRHWGYRGYVPRLGSHGRTLVPRKANKASHELSNLWCGCFIGEKNALSLGSTFPPQVKSLIHDISHWVMPFIKDAWFMVHALFFQFHTILSNISCFSECCLVHLWQAFIQTAASFKKWNAFELAVTCSRRTS